MYLNDTQILQMADAALQSYQVANHWRNARLAAYQFAVNQFGISPRTNAVVLAMKLAQSKCYGIKIKSRRKLQAAA